MRKIAIRFWCLSVLMIACAATAQEAPRTRAEVMDRVFMTVQRGQSSVAGQALAQAATRIAAGSEALSQLLRERQDKVELTTTLIERVGQVAQDTGAEAEARLVNLEALIAGARLRVAELDRQLENDFPEFKELTNPAPMSIAEVQAALRPDEALLLTFVDDNFTYVWAVSQTRADWHQVEVPRVALADQVQLLRGQLSGSGGENRAGVSLKKNDFIARVQPFDRAIAFQLYTQMFAPLEPVFEQASHLMIVMDGPLGSLPPAVLVARQPVGADTEAEALRQTEWMIARHALTTLPGVSALRALRRAPSAPALQDLRKGDASPFLGFGDPVLGYRLTADATAPSTEGQVVTRGIYEDITRVADLAPLPNTAGELRRMAQVMGAGDDALFLASEATETNVKTTDLSRAKVIAFATHGLLADGLPGLREPALVFTPPDKPTPEDDALLTASEAAQLKMSAELVILSACDTAGSDGTPGAEGLSGLARAFIYAGARAILVSHWPVDDFAASALTTGMLERMEHQHISRAEALRASALDLMRNGKDPRFAHPAIWAPFVVVGEGGAE